MPESVHDPIRLNDAPSLAIVHANRDAVGDIHPGRTLVRIIQAFHASGLSLTPNAPGSEGGAVSSAAPPRSGVSST